jgi:hypothetical protein
MLIGNGFCLRLDNSKARIDLIQKQSRKPLTTGVEHANLERLDQSEIAGLVRFATNSLWMARDIRSLANGRRSQRMKWPIISKMQRHRKIHMSKRDELRLAAAEILQALGPAVERFSELKWSPSDGTLPIIRSAMLRRQYECLSIAVDLVDKSHGFAAVALLRPACEEFLWAKYLSSLEPSDAENILVLMGQREVRDSLAAQDSYAGRAASDNLGLTRFVMQHESSAKALNARTRVLGTKLGWDKRTIEGAKLPSVAFVAKAVGETSIYRFLYHASSRYVHFSPAELLRRAWGKTGNVTVSSMHFTDYWGAFVLYWGVHLIVSTLPILLELGNELDLDDSIDGDKLIAAASRIRDHGAVPIITAEELAWETDAG